MPNVAVTWVASNNVSVHGSVPLQPAPDQPVNAASASGAAERVTCVPWANVAVHAEPHAIPAGSDTTVPAPWPDFSMVSSTLGTAASSKPAATLGCEMPTREARITPARPASDEQMRYARVMCARTSMPARRTASSLPPMAMIVRPGVVRLRKKLIRRYTTSMRSVIIGIGPSIDEPIARKPGSLLATGTSEMT